MLRSDGCLWSLCFVVLTTHTKYYHINHFHDTCPAPFSSMSHIFFRQTFSVCSCALNKIFFLKFRLLFGLTWPDFRGIYFWGMVERQNSKLFGSRNIFWTYSEAKLLGLEKCIFWTGSKFWFARKIFLISGLWSNCELDTKSPWIIVFPAKTTRVFILISFICQLSPANNNLNHAP